VWVRRKHGTLRQILRRETFAEDSVSYSVTKMQRRSGDTAPAKECVLLGRRARLSVFETRARRIAPLTPSYRYDQ